MLFIVCTKNIFHKYLIFSEISFSYIYNVCILLFIVGTFQILGTFFNFRYNAPTIKKAFKNGVAIRLFLYCISLYNISILIYFFNTTSGAFIYHKYMKKNTQKIVSCKNFAQKFPLYQATTAVLQTSHFLNGKHKTQTLLIILYYTKYYKL